MISSTLIGKPTRPSKTDKNKNMAYDLAMAKFYLNRASGWKHEAYKTKCFVNRAMANGDQWIFSEDLDPFLLDTNGGFRNRVRFIQNIIKPIIRQYVGSAIKTDYSYTIFPSSETAISRKIDQMHELALMDYASKMMGGYFRGFIEQNLPVGNTEGETVDLFNKSYKDKFVDDIRKLVSFISTEVNDLEELKVRLTKHLVVDGLGIIYGYERNKQQFFEIIDPVFSLLDRSAKRPDFRDAEFQGDWYYTYPSSIFDKVDLTAPEKKALDDYARSGSGSAIEARQYLYNYSDGNVPVYRLFWKDIESREYGYVQDISGNVFYTRINHDGGKYKTRDLVDPPEYDKHIFGKGRMIKVDGEVLRFCEFVPGDIIGYKFDIVLAHGLYAYQEKSASDPSGVEFPYKNYAWEYQSGLIYSPIDDVISPQRFVNRAISMGEAQMNNARPGGTVLSRTAIMDTGEDEVQRQINSGETVVLNTDQVNNAVSSYKSTFGDGTAELFNIAGAIQEMTTRSTGMNEAMLGNVGGKRELRGVVDAMIQRGSLMIEDVFFALNMVLKNVYQAMAEQGKLIYRGTKQIVMDKEDPLRVAAFEITDDHINELFKTKVVRTPSRDEQIASANMTMIQMYQLGMLDDKRVAKLFNNSDMDDIARAMDAYTEEKAVMQQAAAAAQEQAMGQAEERQQQNIDRSMTMQDTMDRRKNTANIINTLLKTRQQ